MMPFFTWFRDRVGSVLGSDNQPEPTRINPATGLPMIGGGGVDVQGNPYGTDLQDHHHHSSTHDSWSSSSSDHDDWWRWGSSGSSSSSNDW
jgi:hypothetical protein